MKKFPNKQVKKELTAQGDETVSNDIVGQAHLENITVNLFSWADTEDRSSNFNKYASFSHNYLLSSKIIQS